MRALPSLREVESPPALAVPPCPWLCALPHLHLPAASLWCRMASQEVPYIPVFSYHLAEGLEF